MKPTEVEKYTEEDYDEMLNDLHGTIEIGCCSFDASTILKELDPIAYNVGFNDMQEYEYECSECSTRHESIDDAEECCKE